MLISDTATETVLNYAEPSFLLNWYLWIVLRIIYMPDKD